MSNSLPPTPDDIAGEVNLSDYVNSLPAKPQDPLPSHQADTPMTLGEKVGQVANAKALEWLGYSAGMANADVGAAMNSAWFGSWLYMGHAVRSDAKKQVQEHLDSGGKMEDFNFKEGSPSDLFGLVSGLKKHIDPQKLSSAESGAQIAQEIASKYNIDPESWDSWMQEDPWSKNVEDRRNDTPRTPGKGGKL